MFSDQLIKEYKEWKTVNGDQFTWWSFVNYKYDVVAALAFIKFFNPEIVEHDGCYFLKDSLSLTSYKGWKEEFKNDRTSIEKMINLYEPKDFFHINPVPDDLENGQQLIIAFAEALREQWEVSLRSRYPDVKFIVELFEEDKSDLYIRVFVERVSGK